MGVSLPQQVATKQSRASQLLSTFVTPDQWLAPVTSAETGFRNKAKLAVSGSVQEPTLGIALPHHTPVDLRECGIQQTAIWQAIPDLAGFVRLTGIAPYDVTEDTGDFKFIHVTASPNGQLMLRFVVRRQENVDRLRAALPALLARLPQVSVASANILAEHRAALAGDIEIPLTDQQELAMPMGDVTLYVRSHSFFQTNSDVAAQLYAQAARWADELAPTSVVDVYCGVGGFALSMAKPGRTVRGIEVEPSAIECARKADVHELVEFQVMDGTQLSTTDVDADLVIVNPPRRGIGPLAETLNDSHARHVIYSSCNPTTLATDLAAMTSYAVVHARLFDMFPHTHHSEIAVLLRKIDT